MLRPDLDVDLKMVIFRFSGINRASLRHHCPPPPTSVGVAGSNPDSLVTVVFPGLLLFMKICVRLYTLHVEIIFRRSEVFELLFCFCLCPLFMNKPVKTLYSTGRNACFEILILTEN